MRPLLFTAIAASALVASVAIAQPAPPPGGPQGGPPPGGPPHGMEGMEGHGGWMHGRRRMPPPTKAAFFNFRHGEDVVTVKCADDEPTKACTDAVAAMIAAIRPPAK